MAGVSNAQTAERALAIELQRHGSVPLMMLPQHVRRRLRLLGYKETSLARKYVSGQKMTVETADFILCQLRSQHHVYVTPDTTWTNDLRALCPQWRAVRKHVNHSYSEATKGRNSTLTSVQRMWLRDYAYAHPKMKGTDYRLALFQATRISLTEGRINEILHEMGATRKNVTYIASQRSDPANLDYARRFGLHVRVRHLTNVAFFDESGITPRGMSQRRNDGWAPVGSLGAFIRKYLTSWPPNHCITVQGFLDKNGFWGQDVHIGGTDWVYLKPYFEEMAWVGRNVRHIDGIIIDNCPAHNAEEIKGIFRRYGIHVMFLPRYYPQWNPIEICWNWMKDFLMNHIAELRTNPCRIIRMAMNTVTAELAKSWIRHCGIYPTHFYN